MTTLLLSENVSYTGMAPIDDGIPLVVEIYSTDNWSVFNGEHRMTAQGHNVYAYDDVWLVQIQ